MARRTLNRHELRAAAEAAEALGLNTPADSGARRPARSLGAASAAVQTRGRSPDADGLGRLRYGRANRRYL